MYLPLLGLAAHGAEEEGCLYQDGASGRGIFVVLCAAPSWRAPTSTVGISKAHAPWASGGTVGNAR